MQLRIFTATVALVCCAALANAQSPLALQISGGRVTLHAQNVPVRTILAEWARVGGARIVNGDRVTAPPVTLDLEGVPERVALDILLRGVSGYVVAAREPGTAGVSLYDRIMILPTSAAPRNPPPAAAPVFQGAGGVRPIMPRPDDPLGFEDPNDGGQGNDGFPLARPMPVPRPVGVPVAPPITIAPDDDPQAQPQQVPPGMIATPTN